jgi:outer membrane protein TolC
VRSPVKEIEMFRMQASIGGCPIGAVLATLILAANSSAVFAAGLSLAAAESLALEDDPGVSRIESSRQALDELAVAAEQLPDPIIKMGLMSLPTDTFEFGQEAMTQVQVGVVQKFPRGRSRELRSAQYELRSDGLDEAARDRALQTKLAVRELYVEVVKQGELARINRDAIAAFAEVADITRDYYATGRVQQQDALQAAVELAKVEDRAARIAQDEEQARSHLSAWIGNAAFTTFEDAWPTLAPPADAAKLRAGLMMHPRVEALQKNIAAAETGVELARQRYKPEFGVDLTYGGRSGSNLDGSPRSDLLSLMVVMDVPLFTRNRQDRVIAAQVAETSAVRYTLDDELRRMRSEIESQAAAQHRLEERLALFEETLLPQAEFSSEASMNAYRSSLVDLTTLLRAQITEFDLQSEYVRLKAEMLKTRARLHYLAGDAS